MKQIYYPYITGTDNPIAYLFEKIAPYVSEEFKVKIHKDTTKEIFESENITSVHTSDDNILNKVYKLAKSSLSPCDIVHTGGNGEIGLGVSQLTRLRSPDRKHVHSLRVDVVPEYDGRNTTIRKLTAQEADIVTAVSQHTAQTAKNELGIDAEIIYNGVDTELFHPEYSWPRLFEQLGIDSSPFIYVGAFWKRKRPSDVVELAKRCPSYDFIMIGDGNLFNQIEYESVDVENLYLTGRLPKSSLPAIYANALGLVFPTVQEGCPNVVLEALSSETPVIGYQATSMPELVESGKTGFLADVGDIETLSTYIDTVAGFGEELGRNARIYIQNNHSFEQISSQYIDLYNKLI